MGSGLTETGDVQLTIGTGIQLVTPLNGPVLPGTGRRVAGRALYRAATDVGHYAMAASLNGGSTLGWVREILGVSWAELYAAANHRPAPGNGLVFLPHLHGERTPHLDPTMRGGWLGLSSEHTRTDLLYAALLGVACAARQALDALVEIQPVASVGALRLAGGGTVLHLAPVAWIRPRPGACRGRGAVGLGSRRRLPRRPGRRVDHRLRPIGA